jgi:hypothetical protein
MSKKTFRIIYTATIEYDVDIKTSNEEHARRQFDKGKWPSTPHERDTYDMEIKRVVEVTP